MTLSRLLIPAAALTLLAGQVTAQAAEGAMAAPEDCVVEPQAGDGLAMPDETPLDPMDDPTLSETLDPCDGVMTPDAVGDDEMTIMPPEGGETPVIAPDDLPPQPPQGD